MVKINGIKKSGFTLIKTQNTILSAAFILAVASGINAFLGFVKNRMLASRFGVSEELAVFYTADRIPNLIYSILVVGAVSTVFIPTFTNLLKRDKERAFKVATALVMTVLGIFLFLGSLIYFFAPQIMNILSVGKFSSQEILLGTDLMRIMIFAQILLVGGSLITSILQSYKYFLVPALAPIFYNLGMIFGIVFLTEQYGIYGPTYGILIGAVFHFGVQVPLLKKTHFTFMLDHGLEDRSFKKALLLVPPRILQVAIASGVQTINNSLAILVSSAAVVYLKFATQLQSFPVSIFGLSMAAASLPTLSTQTDENSITEFKKSLATSIHQMLFLVMPISMILFVLRVPTVRIVYGVSNFPWEATLNVSYALAFFSLSIFSQSTNYVLTRAFFALKDTKTPVLISLITAVINITISTSLVTIFNLGVWSVALAFSITSILDTIALLYFLSKKVHGFKLTDTLVPFVKISYATLLMGVTLYAGLKLLDVRVLDTTKTLNLLILTFVTTLAGSVTYLGLTKLLKVEEIELFYKLVRKLRFRKSPSIAQSEAPPLGQ